MPAIGTVHLVGAGPGDPELITLKAANLIRRCDALVYDYLVAEALREWVKPGCRRICVGKRAGFHSKAQAEIESLLIELAREGLETVRLKGGDPFVFGRGGEEARALAKAGIPFQIVPAVTASIGCASAAGIPLTHRAASGAVTMISGHQAPGHPSARPIDWASHAQTGATLAIYMGMGHLDDIARALISAGKDPTTPCAIVQWGTTPRERVLRSALADLSGEARRAGFAAPAIVYVGAVVDLTTPPTFCAE